MSKKERQFLQNAPAKHHYIPAFYTKRWADPVTHQLIEFSKPRDEVISRRKHPNATGFLTRLYELRDFPDQSRQRIEERFFRPVDNGAHGALSLLETDGPPAIERDTSKRSAWIRFIMSLLLRCPEDLAFLRKYWTTEFLKPDYVTEARYQAVRTDSDPATLAEFIAGQPPAMSERNLFQALLKFIQNPKVSLSIDKMSWGVADVSKSRFRLLTSDRPIFKMAFADPAGHIGLPIGPNRFFVATSTHDFMRQLQQVKPDDLVREINRQIVEQAVKYVYAGDEGQAEFVAKHFALSPQRRMVEDMIDAVRFRNETRVAATRSQNPQ
jgi:hypothetical protein